MLTIGWWLWSPAKTEFSCDGRNSGASTPELAAASFVESLAARDSGAACRIITNKMGQRELQLGLDEMWARLGEPTDPKEIGVTVGVQSGNSYPLRLEGPGGAYEVTILSFLDWYRVTLP